MPDKSAISGPFLRCAQAIEYTALPRSTFHRLVNEGLLPSPVKMGPRISLFSQPAIDAAISMRAAASKGEKS